jgi:hypothetical protein
MTSFDIIPDIHGQHDKLIALLHRLGWRNADGAWRPPEADRKIVFLGDFIDRGPHNAKVIRTVRELVESQHAFAIMGNHELNAIHYHTIDPETGKPFRAHTERNQSAHGSFLTEFPIGSSDAKDAIDWFAKLPLWLDVGPFRVIHACWSDAAVERLREQAPDGVLPYDRLLVSGRKGDRNHADVSLLTKGPEVRLPEGTFRDGGGQVRDEVRLAWWRRNASTWREAVVSVPDPSELPDSPISEDVAALLYPENAKPLFFGHYWMTGSIALEAPNAICLDYSAARGGPLIAYRFSPDDRGLSLSNIVG